MRHILPAAVLALLFACEEPPTTAKPAPMVTTPAPKPSEEEGSHWVKRTDLELDAALRETCAASVADGKPMLLEFSAPWCVDCRRLLTLAKDEAVKAELDQFHRLTVDVGKWDRHQPLTEAFGVSVLAWWAVMQPTDCSAPPPKWPRLKEGGFEPESSKTGVRTAEGVVTWLKEARTQ